MPQILIVDDSDIDRLFVAALVEKNTGCPTLQAANGNAALASIKQDTAHTIAAVLLDLSMPEMDGRSALPAMLALRPDLQVIAITGSMRVTDVVDIVRAGAADYLTKPVDADLLRNALAKALHLYNLTSEVQQLRNKDTQILHFGNLVGQSAALQTSLKLGQRAALSDITVLITGESGTGKELLARAMHAASARAAKAFIAVNCGAIPKDLVESTLFGHKKGAFTGAFADAIGKFVEADGGTLFLDEIGELPMEAQVKLLRALQERVIEPVGSNKTIPINIRIIAATNRDPLNAMRQGHLREDLFYRLNAFPIHMPPLRDRKGDLKPLSEHFLKHYAAVEGKSIRGFTKAAEDWLGLQRWTGNVRELENTIFRAVLLCDGQFISTEHLDTLNRAPPKPLRPTHDEAGILSIQLVDDHGVFKRMEVLHRQVEAAALAYHHNNIVLAARQLGIGKSTLYRHQQHGGTHDE